MMAGRNKSIGEGNKKMKHLAPPEAKSEGKGQWSSRVKVSRVSPRPPKALRRGQTPGTAGKRRYRVARGGREKTCHTRTRHITEQALRPCGEGRNGMREEVTNGGHGKQGRREANLAKKGVSSLYLGK